MIYSSSYKLLFIVILLSLSLIVSCVFQKKNDFYLINNISTLKWKKRKQALIKINYYKINGSLIYINNQKKIYIPFFLQKLNKDNYRLLIFNIFGLIEYKIYIKSNNIIKVMNNKGKYYTNNNIEKIIGQITGIYISLKNIFSWVIGLPGDSNNYQINNKNQLYQIIYFINNQKCKIDIKRYNNKLIPSLPTKIEFKLGNKKIKLFINKWILE